MDAKENHDPRLTAISDHVQEFRSTKLPVGRALKPSNTSSSNLRGLARDGVSRPLGNLGNNGQNRSIGLMRKRDPLEPIPAREVDVEGNNSGEPKRRRGLDFPEFSNAKNENAATGSNGEASTDDLQPSNPARPSKFQEGSMNDKPSDTPPSVFTRHPKLQKESSLDCLMDEYVNNMTAPPRPKGSGPTITESKAANLLGLTHHPNMSISSNATAMTSDSRHSGIYRFGRSIASNINPVNIWQKASKKWSDAKEDQQNTRTKRLVDQQIEAELAYAELKRNGQPGTLGNRQYRNNRPPIPQGFIAQTADLSNQRDSGIDMPADYRRSFDVPSVVRSEYHDKPLPNPHASNTGSVHRGSIFTFRTPSLGNLKKNHSEISLHQRSSSITHSNEHGSTEQYPASPIQTLHPSPSKKDLQKQARLVKKVSDLETKLEAARRELAQYDTDAPPVPLIPAGFTAPFGSPARPSTNARTVFSPLPTLLSESLLVDHEAEADIPKPSIELESEIRENSILHSGTSLQAPPSESTHPGTRTPRRKQPILEAGLGTITQPSPAPADTSTPALRRSARKRKSINQDLSYKPSRESSGDDDAEWDEACAAQPKVQRRTRSTVTARASVALNASQNAPVAAKDKSNLPSGAPKPSGGNSSGNSKPRVLTKPRPTPTPQPTYHHASAHQSHTNLEIVTEESAPATPRASTGTQPSPTSGGFVNLNGAARTGSPVSWSPGDTAGSPSRATGPLLVPAGSIHPPVALEPPRLGSNPRARTPAKGVGPPGRGRARVRGALAVAGGDSGSGAGNLECPAKLQKRSRSTGKGSPAGKRSRSLGREEDEAAVRIVPGEEDVPPLPRAGAGGRRLAKDEFEWPDDVF